MFFRKNTPGGRACLQIVENRREDGAVRKQVIATLGRLEDLRHSGQIGAAAALGRALRRQGHRRARRRRRRGNHGRGATDRTALMFEWLWEETGLL